MRACVARSEHRDQQDRAQHVYRQLVTSLEGPVDVVDPRSLHYWVVRVQPSCAPVPEEPPATCVSAASERARID